MKQKITDILRADGIQNVGFCNFDAVKEHLLDCRAKERLPQNSKTIIICTFPYKVTDEPPHLISRYAAVPDYHTVVGKKLEGICRSLSQKYPQNCFAWFCDNSPIPEVYAAATAGLGKRGDNGLLITKEHGSFVFLGEIVTDLPIDCQNNYTECSHCGKCKTSCPVALDKTKCLSDLSQKKKLTANELQILKEHSILWGCDICQNTCPLNQKSNCTDITEFTKGYRNEYIIGEDTQDRAYIWRGTEPINRNANNLGIQERFCPSKHE